MRRTNLGLLALLATLVAGPAPAQSDLTALPWRLLGTNSMNVTFRVLAPTVSPDNPNWRRIQVLSDYAEPLNFGNGFFMRSMLDTTEVDCATFNYRVLAVRAFTGPGGSGEARDVPAEGDDWGPSPAPAMSRRVAEAACGAG